MGLKGEEDVLKGIDLYYKENAFFVTSYWDHTISKITASGKGI